MVRYRALIAGASLALLASASSLAADLTVTTYAATPAGFAVNSHLIQGERDAILVDAQFTLGEAAKAVEMVQRSGKRLKYIVVTHGHPDHFFGLEVFRRAFLAATAAPATKEQASATLKAQYADYALPMIVDFSVGGRLEN